MKKTFLFSLLLTFLITLNLDAQLVGTGHTGQDGLSTFYTINPSTGAATAVGPVGFQRCGALAVHPTTGILYAIGERDDGSDLPVLLTIDPTTGAGTEVGVTGFHTFGDAYAGLSFRSDGVLFAYLEANDGLGTIDINTGALTELGGTNVGCCGNGIAFDNSNVLYHANEINLHTLNQTTANATVVTALGYPAPGKDRMSSLDFDPVSGVLYGIKKGGSGGGGPTHLATIDVATGTVTQIGLTVNNMDGLAFMNVSAAAVPTMGEWGLIILGLLVLSFGTVFMMRRQTAMAGMAGASFSTGNGIPFQPQRFLKMLVAVLFALTIVFAVSVLFFNYEITSVDLPGSLIAAPIAAYLIHLLFGEK